MAAAKLTDPPPEVYRALVAHPLNPPEPYEAHERYGPYGSHGSYKLRFPYGRGLAKDGAIVLFNSKEHPLLRWPPGSWMPERCDSRQVPALVAREYFCSNCAIPAMGSVTLWHALDTLLNSWLRGDRATAAALERWLVGKYRIYQKVVQERTEIREELARAKAEAERRTWDPSMT